MEILNISAQGGETDEYLVPYWSLCSLKPCQTKSRIAFVFHKKEATLVKGCQRRLFPHICPNNYCKHFLASETKMKTLLFLPQNTSAQLVIKRKIKADTSASCRLRVGLYTPWEELSPQKRAFVSPHTQIPWKLGEPLRAVRVVLWGDSVRGTGWQKMTCLPWPNRNTNCLCEGGTGSHAK